MQYLELLMDRGLDVGIVKERYGDGFACFLGTSETVDIISDAVTGGDTVYEDTHHLHDGWYPYTVGSTPEKALQTLRDKIAEQVTSAGFTTVSTVYEVASARVSWKGNLNLARHWPSDITVFYKEWSDGTEQ